MNTPAIHKAIRLEKHPDEMSWLCFPDSDLPEGISDLLRLCAYEEQLIEFATTNDLNSEELTTSLFNFIEKVMLNEKNSDEKILGTDSFSSLQQQKFHYKLLKKIYQTKTNQRPNSDHYLTTITNAYERLIDKEEKQDVISFSEYRKSPTSYQSKNVSEEHISHTKTAIAIVSSIALFTLVAMTGKFFNPANINSTADNNIVQDNNSDAQQIVKVTSLKSNTLLEPSIKPSIKASSTLLQSLLKKLEIAYEKGDVKTLKPILANAPELKSQTDKQLTDKLETIFEITSERKMVLFDFKWTSTAGLLEGKGKFISRYQLVGEDKWLSRNGTASITAKKTYKSLKITQLTLENHTIE